MGNSLPATETRGNVEHGTKLCYYARMTTIPNAPTRIWRLPSGNTIRIKADKLVTAEEWPAVAAILKHTLCSGEPLFYSQEGGPAFFKRWENDVITNLKDNSKT